MNQGKWFATVTITDQYQCLSDLLDDVPGFPNLRVLTNGSLRTSVEASDNIRISRVPPSFTTGSDDLSKLFAPGEGVEFARLDSTHIYVKTTGAGHPNLEVETEDL